MAWLALCIGLAFAALGLALSSSTAVVALLAAWLLVSAAVTTSRRVALAVIAGLLIGHAAFTLDFAKIGAGVGGITLYVTEFGLSAVLVGSLLSGRLGKSWSLLLTSGSFVGVGGVLLIYALFTGADPQLALRQSALFYYALAAPALAANLELDKDRALVIFVLATATTLALGLAAYRVLSGQFTYTEDAAVRYVSGDVGAFLAMVFLILLLIETKSDLMNAGLSVAAIGVLAAVFLSQHRSVWIATAIAYVLVAPIGLSARKVARTLLVVMPFLLIAFVSLVGDPTGAVSNTVGRVLTTTDTTAPDAAWRLAAWDQAVTDIAKNPIAGSGLGAQFQFRFAGVVIAEFPHNSVLDVAWYSGVLGLAAFTAIQFLFVARVWATRNELRRIGWRPEILLGAWLVLVGAASFNVLLENPYGAVPFWSVVAIPFARPYVAARWQSALRPTPAYAPVS
jgi:O-antigen ligase